MIYLDNNATTPLLAPVREAMLLDLDGVPRNPSSVTKLGREAKVWLSRARKTIGERLQFDPDHLVFSSGATESNNQLIHSFYQLARRENRHSPILTTKVEHSSILKPLENLNHPITYIDVGEKGAASYEEVKKHISKDTPFMIFCWANGETGSLLDIEAIGSLAKEFQVPLIIDSVSMLGKTHIQGLLPGVSAMSFSAHKCHGPKGVGFSVIDEKYPFYPLLQGGSQEKGLRAGTENLAGILGLAKAIELIPHDAENILSTLRDTFEKDLLQKFPNFCINGSGLRNSNTSNVYFKGYDAEELLIHLDQNNIIVSLGSACSSGSIEPSFVLLGMGYSTERARSSIRISFSRVNTEKEITEVMQFLQKSLSKN